MKIAIICSVRAGTPIEVYKYVKQQEDLGNKCYLPPRDTPQDDPSGYSICLRMRQAILQADEVHIFYESLSQGVHFDMGMAFMAGKKWKIINKPDDIKEKSYIKVVMECE